MDLSTFVVLVGLNIVFDLIALAYRASLFSTIAGLVMLSGLSLLVNDHQIVIRSSLNPATGLFVNNLGSTSDYNTFVVMAIIFMMVSFVITITMRGTK